jgi:hypothetical protein
MLLKLESPFAKDFEKTINNFQGCFFLQAYLASSPYYML